jgi:hypothetical protein
VNQGVTFMANDECGIVEANGHRGGTQHFEVTVFIVEKGGARRSDQDEFSRKRGHVWVKVGLEMGDIVNGGGDNCAVRATASVFWSSGRQLKMAAIC